MKAEFSERDLRRMISVVCRTYTTPLEDVLDMEWNAFEEWAAAAVETRDGR